MNSLTSDFKVATRNFKISYICELEFPNTDLVTHLLNPENGSFENVSIVTFK